MQHLIGKIDIDCCIPCFQYIPVECPTLLLKLGYAVKLNQVQLDVDAFKSILKNRDVIEILMFIFGPRCVPPTPPSTCNSLAIRSTH